MVPACFSTILANTDRNGGQPTEAVLAIVKQVPGTPQNDGSMVSVAAAAQTWVTGDFQKDVQERHPGLRAALMPLFDTLGLTRARVLRTDQYTQIADNDLPMEFLLAGATKAAMTKRIVFAGGIQYPRPFQRAAVLGSIRQLTQKEIDEFDSPDGVQQDASVHFGLPMTFMYPQTEADMGYLVYRTMQPTLTSFRDFPADCDKVVACNKPRPAADAPYDTLKKYRPEPGFDGTVDAWLALRKRMGIPVQACNAIVATSGPSFDRFERIVQAKLPAGSNVYAVGYPPPETLNASQYLNELALLLYECARYVVSG